MHTTTPKAQEGKDRRVLAQGEALSEDKTMPIDSNHSTMYTNVPTNATVLDLYCVSELSRRKQTSVPFVHQVQLHGPRGEIVRQKATADAGALISAIEETVWRKKEGRLKALTTSGRWLRMADGRVVPSIGTWQGKMTWAGIECEGEFEVFKGGDAWEVLIGKPMLEAMGAVHDHASDTMFIPNRSSNSWVAAANQHPGSAPTTTANSSPPHLTQETNQGDSQSPTRGVSNIHSHKKDVQPTDKSVIAEHSQQTSMFLTTEARNANDAAKPDEAKIFKPTTLTRKTKPFAPERVDAVLKEISVGHDLSAEQQQEVNRLLAEYADCFALSMSEVMPVPGAAHRLDIPEGTKFRTKMGARPLNQPQREYLNSVIDTMLEADVIESIDFQDVKCCGMTTLAQKAHDGGGLTIEELQHRVNDECIKHGIPEEFDLPPRPPQRGHDTPETTATKQKWRVCQDFAELNRVTKVPPMPQGDIRSKQQKLAGHRWVSVFDFANGFYACEIRPEDRPYVCFYVEGRGYFAYKRMPFGLTGAPSTFAQMTARALGDLVGTLFELFVDDG